MAESEYTAPDFGNKGLSYDKIQQEVGKTLSSKEHQSISQKSKRKFKTQSQAKNDKQLMKILKQ